MLCEFTYKNLMPTTGLIICYALGEIKKDQMASVLKNIAI